MESTPEEPPGIFGPWTPTSAYFSKPPRKRHVRGSKANSKLQGVGIYFSNITSLSQKALVELEQIDTHIIALAETHVLPKEDNEAFKRITNRIGAQRKKYTTPATPSPNSEGGSRGESRMASRWTLLSAPYHSCKILTPTFVHADSVKIPECPCN